MSKNKRDDNKSSHLKNLENVFEKRVRRFSAFEVLGLENPGGSELSENTVTEYNNLGSNNMEICAPGTDDTIPGIGTTLPGTPTPIYDKEDAVPDPIIPISATEVPSKEVEVNNLKVTTSKQKVNSISGMGKPIPETGEDMGGSVTPMDGSHPTVGDISISGHVIDDHMHGISKPMSARSSPIHGNSKTRPVTENTMHGDSTSIHGNKAPVRGAVASSHESENTTPGHGEHTRSSTMTTRDPGKIDLNHNEDLLIAFKVGSGLGAKSQVVLAYLNNIRSVTNPEFTVPVGYKRIADETQVSLDHIRQNVIPGLAMRGLLAVAAKGFNGSVYHLRYKYEIIDLITSDLERLARSSPIPSSLPTNESYQIPYGEKGTGTTLPSWVDLEHWASVSPVMIQRLVNRVGSEEQAEEILRIIVYNESHGSPQNRVRNRFSVLAQFLSSPQAEIWPNDQSFETLAVRKARLERDEALRTRALAEEAMKAREEERRFRFKTSLSDSQLRWIKQVAKESVDNLPPEQLHFITNRMVHYKAEEERLITEWIERVEYGDSVPSVD